MYGLLLTIIYLAFISLGLPDSLLGAGWPAISESLNIPISYAGIITAVIAGGTVVSSLKADYVTTKFGTGLVTAVSVAMTAIALLGYAMSTSFWMILLWSIPYGLGAGAVDAALNNYVALHLKARHMSWLHCFWGVGVSISPYIMGLSLTQFNNWETGYWIVGIFQILLTLFVFLSIPLWKRGKETPNGEEKIALPLQDIWKIKGVPLILITFFFFCALEQTAGIWAVTYLVEHYGFTQEIAANYGALFYLGITGGRFLGGFITEKVGDKNLIRYGAVLTLAGIAMLPFSATALPGLVITGLGTSPIYPAIIHSTPTNFGSRYSGAIIGVEMASAYVGIIVAPALFGFLIPAFSIGFYPIFLAFLAGMLLFLSEKFNRLMMHY